MRRLGSAPLLLALACGHEPAPEDTAATDTTTDTTSTTTDTTIDLPTTSELPTSTGDAPEPVCCGCLCLDPQWSCTDDTCLLPDGTAAALVPEAGFLAMPAHTFAYDSGSGMVDVAAAEARHWYVFRPADDAPETRPLVVFYNGGPGNSTAILFGLNTGPRTADLDVAGDARVVDNPHSWTRFANLLYIDPHETGFSYDIAPLDGEREPTPFLPEHDAAGVAYTILAFLARHPQLTDAPVVLAGESYGGLRTSLIHQFMLYPGELAGPIYVNPLLLAAIQDHEARLVDTSLARQFGARVLIQPVIAWSEQAEHTPKEERPAALQCVDDPDSGQCDRPHGWSAQYVDAVVDVLSAPSTLSDMAGVDVTTIAWLHPEARVGAIARGGGLDDDSPFAAVLGPLAEGDLYYAPTYLRGNPPGYAWNSARYDIAFFRTLPGVRTFITDAGKDLVVFTPDFPAVIAARSDIIAAAEHDAQPVPGSDRPGRIVFTYRPELGLPAQISTIRFPHYAGAGHMVTHRAPGELLADVEAWLAGE